MPVSSFLYLLAAYFTGNFLAAYWVGRWKGIDLRKHRSGNLGARNAGAVIGKPAFLLTFIGDAGKAAFVVWLGFYLNLQTELIAAGGLTVIVGHLFPVWLSGKGGKGVASFIGASLFLSPFLFLIMAIVFVSALLLIRSATLAMIAGFTAYIAASFLLGLAYSIWPLFIAIALILMRHKKDLIKSYRKNFY